MKKQISQELFMKYYNFMKAAQQGAKCDNNLARKFKISNQSYLACRRMGYIDENRFWVSKNVITEKDVTDVIYTVRKMGAQYQSTYKKSKLQSLPKTRDNVLRFNPEVIRVNPFSPKEKKREISIAWGLFKIIY